MSARKPIQVQGLGKRYALGVARGAQRLFYEDFSQWFGSLVKGRVAGKAEAFWALKNINFEIEEGEVLGIVGRNGAGKSTLLKILSRITPPTEGSAQIAGRMGSLLEVGVGFHPDLTGRENIYLSGALLGMKRVEINRKLDEIIAFAEIERFIDTPVKRYSSGMYVRLAFAVAAHLQPDILVVDEVLAVGDAAFQKKCLEKMGESAHSGRTVLFVSHNMTALRTLCSRALLLESGQIVLDDKPERVIRAYLGGGSATQAQAVWDDRSSAPGNDSSKLHKVFVSEDGITPAFEIDDDKSFSIGVEYWNLKEGAETGASILLINSEGAVVLSSINNSDESWYGKPQPRGLLRSVCRVPAPLLAPGEYSVTVIVWSKNYSDGYTEADVIRFEIQETAAVRRDFFGFMSGIIRPQLQWQSQVVNVEA